jgi:hypothetical protein
MAAAKKSSAKSAKKVPAKKAPSKAKKPVARKKPQQKKATLALVPDQRANALAWFANLSSRILDAEVPELQVLISEARTYDLVGLGEALGDDSQVLALNKAANELIEAGLESFGTASPQGFQLQVLRDILNDS